MSYLLLLYLSAILSDQLSPSSRKQILSVFDNLQPVTSSFKKAFPQPRPQQGSTKMKKLYFLWDQLKSSEEGSDYSRKEDLVMDILCKQGIIFVGKYGINHQAILDSIKLIYFEMCGISAIYILDKKGRVLISRAFRTDVSSNIQDIFNKKILEYDDYTIKPIILDKEDNLFFFHRHVDLIFLAISKKNNNAVMVFSFLFCFIDVLTNYFKEVQEESIRDNFVIVYELLDEMMDNGYPQTTQFKLLSKFIKTESYELNTNSKKAINAHIDATKQMSNVVSWRPEGIKYPKNQFFLDVTEKLSMLIGPNNNIIKSEIIGVVKGNCQLSGMPDLKLGLNDKAYYDTQGRTSKSKAIQFNDIKFHQCVRLGKFENERMITFIPPDGEFELMSYRLEVRVKPLFSIDLITEYTSSTKIKFLVKVKSNYKEKSTANNVQIFVPVPEDVENPVFKMATGSVAYVPENGAFKWSIKSFPGHRQHVMNAEFKLPTIESPNRNKYKKNPINIKFEIPYFTVSGFQVRYLKIVDRSGYKAFPWVRYLTKNGEYQVRSS